MIHNFHFYEKINVFFIALQLSSFSNFSLYSYVLIMSKKCNYLGPYKKIKYPSSQVHWVYGPCVKDSFRSLGGHRSCSSWNLCHPTRGDYHFMCLTLQTQKSICLAEQNSSYLNPNDGAGCFLLQIDSLVSHVKLPVISTTQLANVPVVDKL